MSTDPAPEGYSQPCCSIPPIISKGYSPKGTYEQLADRKTYITGPPSASKAILSIFDIFGFMDQTIQGADIMAHGGGEKYRVFMPDWFDGHPCPIEIYPPNTPEKKKRLADFFHSFSAQRIAALIPEFTAAIRSSNPSVRSIAIVGYCWGAKVAILSSTPSAISSTPPFAATAMLHPAMLSPLDARPLVSPVILLASKDEPRQAVSDFESNIPRDVPRHVEVFGDQVHGWMAARADLENERVREEYERGYCVLIDFLGKHF